MNIDVVITYVNNQDIEWQKSFAEAKNEAITDTESRYRDFGTLPFLFRGIEKNMPWVRNVYLVVCSDSQVPEWINRDNVKIVYHKDIIPQEFLPTFNSTTIEAFLYKIDGLSEHFIYFNDDFFVMNPTTPEDFFLGNKPKTLLLGKEITDKTIEKAEENPAVLIYKSATDLAFKAAGYEAPKNYLLMPPHICQGLRKAAFAEMNKKCGEEIRASLSQFRQIGNLAYFPYIIYDVLNGNGVMTPIDYSYIRLSEKRKWPLLYNSILKCRSKMLCINDILGKNEEEGTFEFLKSNMWRAMKKKFPSKSKYEIYGIKEKINKVSINQYPLSRPTFAGYMRQQIIPIFFKRESQMCRMQSLGISLDIFSGNDIPLTILACFKNGKTTIFKRSKNLTYLSNEGKTLKILPMTKLIVIK